MCWTGMYVDLTGKIKMKFLARLRAKQDLQKEECQKGDGDGRRLCGCRHKCSGDDGMRDLQLRKREEMRTIYINMLVNKNDNQHFIYKNHLWKLINQICFFQFVCFLCYFLLSSSFGHSQKWSAFFFLNLLFQCVCFIWLF